MTKSQSGLTPTKPVKRKTALSLLPPSAASCPLLLLWSLLFPWMTLISLLCVRDANGSYARAQRFLSDRVYTHKGEGRKPLSQMTTHISAAVFSN